MFFENILPVPEGSKITVVELAEYQQWKHKNRRKSDVLFIIYKDANDVKRVRSIENPKVGIFFTKPEYRNEWRTVRKYVPIEKLYPVEINPKRIPARIYEELKECNDERSKTLMDIYERAERIGDWKAKKEILKSQHTFMSDISVEEFYRIMLGYHYDCNQEHVLNKAFLDIESDIYGLTTSEQNSDMDPTNAVTVIFDYNCAAPNGPRKDVPQVFTFLLRNHKRYPQQKYFEDHLDEFITQCHSEFDEVTVTKGGKETIMTTYADYHIRFYGNEADLDKALFKVINTARPDTCAVWNIAYDLPKLRGRMDRQGLNYTNIMCDPNFPEDCRFVEINVDRRPTIDQADRKTYVKMASTTKYVDQMQTYAAIRKGQKAYGSNKLDNIAEVELGIHKRTFGKGIDVTNAAIKDYWNFVLYNINDVWLQVLIDRVTNDMFTLLMDSNQHQCSFENLTKQTKYQKMIYYTEYLRRGFVPGNNKNNDYIRGIIDDYADIIRENEAAKRLRKQIDENGGSIDDLIEPDDDSFIGEEPDPETEELLEKIEDVFADSVDRPLKLKGGLVGNPNLNSCNGEELIPGVPSKHVFKHVVDMDYASEYPWAKFTRSISESTQYGRLIIGEKISDRQNTHNTKNYIPGAEFISDYISQDIISLGEVWFKLPSVEDTISQLKDLLSDNNSDSTERGEQ